MNTEFVVSYVIVLFLAIGIHEYAHCKFADMAGDPTPGSFGRVTLNLFKHFEPVGTIMMVLSSISGFGLGWGRPAPMDPRKMRNPRWDFFAAVAAGPVSNLAQATVYGLLFRLAAQNAGAVPDILLLFLVIGVTANVSIFFFNLIPFGPLDGHYLVGLLMPEKPRFYWFRLNRQIGMIGLFLAILIMDFIRKGGGPDLLWLVLGQPVARTFQLLTGMPHPFL